jgi:hypothetical protein
VAGPRDGDPIPRTGVLGAARSEGAGMLGRFVIAGVVSARRALIREHPERYEFHSVSVAALLTRLDGGSL